MKMLFKATYNQYIFIYIHFFIYVRLNLSLSH